METNTKPVKRRVPSQKNIISLQTDRVEEVEAILKKVPFKEFSIPLYAYKDDVMDTQERSSKVIQVGFVKSYNAKTKTFHILIYNGFKERIRTTIENPVISVDYSIYEEKLAKINRLIIS